MVRWTKLPPPVPCCLSVARSRASWLRAAHRGELAETDRKRSRHGAVRAPSVLSTFFWWLTEWQAMFQATAAVKNAWSSLATPVRAASEWTDSDLRPAQSSYRTSAAFSTLCLFLLAAVGTVNAQQLLIPLASAAALLHRTSTRLSRLHTPIQAPALARYRLFCGSRTDVFSDTPPHGPSPCRVRSFIAHRRGGRAHTRTSPSDPGPMTASRARDPRSGAPDAGAPPRRSRRRCAHPLRL